MRIVAGVAALVLLLGGVTVGSEAAVAALSSGARPDDVTMVSQNLLRDDWDPNEPNLSPAVIKSGGFGQLFATKVIGQVYAQPLVIDNPGTATSAPSGSVIVATEMNYVYSLDAATGAVQWSVNLGTPWAEAAFPCTDLEPDIGITSTPVYDASTNTLYVFAVTADGNTMTTTPTDTLYALDASTGATEWSANISGSTSNTPSQTFNSGLERQRPGLMLMNGSVYIGFGSICIQGPYNGFIARVNVTTHSSTLWADEAGSSTEGAGIWMSGGGPVAFANMPDSIFIASGNGTSPPPGPGGSQTPGTLGDSVIRLDAQPDGTVKADDFFAPADAPTLDVNDRDLGSGGPIGLPFSTRTYPDLIVQAGKDGRVFLLNAKSLGGRNATSDHPLFETGPYGGQWGHPAAFAGAGGHDYVYYSGSGYQSADYMRVLQFNGSNPAKPTLTEVGNSATAFGYTSGSPVVTSNGTDPSSAVVWEVYASDRSGANGTLEALSAIPVNGVLPEIWSAPLGTAAKFSVAATDGGRVYVGTRDDGTGEDPGYGVVYGFGVTSNPPFSGTGQVTVPDAGVGGASSSATVKLTATQTMELTAAPTVSSTTSPAPFTVGAVTLNGDAITSYPATIQPGDKLAVPLRFAPTSAGTFAGSLQIATNVTGFTAVSVPLAGKGTTPGLTVEPATLAFGAPGNGDSNNPNTGPIPVGSSEPFEADITNTSTVKETVTSITKPSAPFSLTGGLTKRQVLAPGQSAAVTITYTPTKATTSDRGSMTVGYTNGTKARTLRLAMTGASVAGSGVLTSPAKSYDFGSVPYGQSASTTLTFTNTGNLPVTVTGFSAPGLPFLTSVPVPKGLSLAPGDEISVPVVFTPQVAGGDTGTYQITTSDKVHKARTVSVTVHGTVGPQTGTVVPGPGGGWTLNGSAAMKGTTLVLTQVARSKAGSAVFYQPMAATGLTATFTEQSNGGTGGDGMTFAMLSPRAPSSLLGGTGQLLGFGDLRGVAIVVGTRKDPGFPSANFVGIATGTSKGHLVFAATSSSVPDMRKGTHVIGVTVSGKTISVAVDGKNRLSKTVPSLPATVLPAFTAATSSADDLHAISKVTITGSGVGTIPPPGGGWSYNGTAKLTGSNTVLTPVAKNTAGTVIYPHAVSITNLTAQFNVRMSGGSGANGIAFALLSPATSPSAVGANGTGLGFYGLTGMEIMLSTNPAWGVDSDNFVSIATSNGSSVTLVNTRAPVGQLRSGNHLVTVTVGELSSGQYDVTVYVDGYKLEYTNVTLPPTALVAFTGSTGALTDMHVVNNAVIDAN